MTYGLPKTLIEFLARWKSPKVAQIYYQASAKLILQKLCQFAKREKIWLLRTVFVSGFKLLFVGKPKFTYRDMVPSRLFVIKCIIFRFFKYK